jgi:beta-galactosidase/beta-glucuronidase
MELGRNSAILATLFLIFTAICLKSGGLLEKWRDHREEKAVDNTEEWQRFKQAFEVKK